MSKQLTFLDYGVAATQEEFLKESIINRKSRQIDGFVSKAPPLGLEPRTL